MSNNRNYTIDPWVISTVSLSIELPSKITQEKTIGKRKWEFILAIHYVVLNEPGDFFF